SKLKLYRLRRAVTITADDTPVHAVIGTAENSRRDPRFAETVSRFYGAVDTAAEEAAFTAFRWQHGVFEGAAELIPEKALPLEARLDLDAGISFEKGCYIGQEVTARTRYRGLVKRSFVPVRLTSVLASPAQITAAGKDAGDLLACLADGDAALGLASVRLAFLNDPETPLEVGGEVITPFLPPRLLPLPGTDQNSG
ncbi:MAG: folate-binding protein, partial [Candidatus Puniceispirillales bacterium]